MPTLCVMVGVPGSGKSTIAEAMAITEGGELYSSDAYRLRLLGDEADQSNNAKVFEALYRDLKRALMSGKYCIMDATNITLKDRMRLMRQLEGIPDVRKIAYVVNTKIEDCYIRDAQRKRSVGKEVIDKCVARFNFPQKYEGWDDIYIHKLLRGPINAKNSPMVDKTISMFNLMIGFDQKNPHHCYSLEGHCLRVAKNYTSRLEYAAGVWHDIGKVFTQVVDDNGVAHYYGHDSVGAYTLMTNLEIPAYHGIVTIDDLCEMLFYVNWHMRAHRDLCGERAKAKYQALFGLERYDRLMQFAEYDRIASGTYEGRK